MATHEVVRKEHARSSSRTADDDKVGMSGMEVFEPGDEITPTEAELSAFPDRFREIRIQQDNEAEDDDSLNPSGMTVAEVSEAVETGEYDDELEEIEELETEGDDRKGVHQAIEERRQE